ncbi:MAG: PQQ-binding-like beta-propeller repeat protein, partial [Phycisphaerales bacterium]
FDKKTGKVLWKRDLVADFGAPLLNYGYGGSPIVYGNTIILSVGRTQEGQRGSRQLDEEAKKEAEAEPKDQTLVAFEQATGRVVWKQHDYPVSYPSPILINFDGTQQLVALMAQEIIGVNPDDGQLLWHHAFTPNGNTISSPVWDGKDLLFFSSAYECGSRALRLVNKEGKTVPEELWYSRKLRIHHGNAIHLGDTVYASSGDFGPAFLMAMNLETGKRLWLERGFGKSNFIYADGKMIILDEDGQLALATVSPEGITIHAKCKVAEPYAWAAPTLVGKTLYVRDRKHIIALDLG